MTSPEMVFLQALAKVFHGDGADPEDALLPLGEIKYVVADKFKKRKNRSMVITFFLIVSFSHNLI